MHQMEEVFLENGITWVEKLGKESTLTMTED
jgi:hypothetical protein